jgi:hypothetical protein
MGPHWEAVARLSDNRLRGLMREIAELIDDTSDPNILRDLRASLSILKDGAHVKAWHNSKGKLR